MFCTVSLSDFLHRFAGTILTVPKSFFFPHNLAYAVYPVAQTCTWLFVAPNRSCLSLLEPPWSKGYT
jgi:hypothetical protein